MTLDTSGVSVRALSVLSLPLWFGQSLLLKCIKCFLKVTEGLETMCGVPGSFVQSPEITWLTRETMAILPLVSARYLRWLGYCIYTFSTSRTTFRIDQTA